MCKSVHKILYMQAKHMHENVSSVNPPYEFQNILLTKPLERYCRKWGVPVLHWKMIRSSISSPNISEMECLRDASQVVRRTFSMILAESDSDLTALLLSPQDLGPLSPDLSARVSVSPASGLSSPLALVWRSSSVTPEPSPGSWCCSWCSCTRRTR